MTQLMAEISQFEIMVGCIAFAALAYFMYSIFSDTVCANCKKTYSKTMLGAITSPFGNFCCARCEQEYRNREADIRHKERSAGKGIQYTRINRKL
ncbi:MAG: hypothetical protein J7L15_00820 [Clostridiales bacterium]|nr:hypothetical protein [Clostridiales bacterium]